MISRNIRELLDLFFRFSFRFSRFRFFASFKVELAEVISLFIVHLYCAMTIIPLINPAFSNSPASTFAAASLYVAFSMGAHCRWRTLPILLDTRVRTCWVLA